MKTKEKLYNRQMSFLDKITFFCLFICFLTFLVMGFFMYLAYY